MLRVHKFGPAFGLADASPFVMKVETYLRMTGQNYETLTGDVRKSPRGQFPVLEVDGKFIPDSTAILEHLEGQRDKKLDAHLGPRERAVAQAFKSMLEEHLYFGVLYMRWATDDGWAVFEPVLRGLLGQVGVPSFLRGLIAKQARKQVSAKTVTQGMGRQSREDVVKACSTILDALAVQLGDGPYLMGEQPTTYDATAYAFAAGALCPAFDNEVRKKAASLPALVAYEARLREKYWKE